jgi:hypothetical protein
VQHSNEPECEEFEKLPVRLVEFLRMADSSVQRSASFVAKALGSRMMTWMVLIGSQFSRDRTARWLHGGSVLGHEERFSRPRRTAGVGFESGPSLSIDDGGF